MVLSMKERNDKKAWAAYEKEAKKLMKKTMKKREQISARHANDPPAKGLGLTAEDREARRLTQWYREELIKLQIKHGIK